MFVAVYCVYYSMCVMTDRVKSLAEIEGNELLDFLFSLLPLSIPYSPWD